jgi:hypothetical protein
MEAAEKLSMMEKGRIISRITDYSIILLLFYEL